MRSDKASDFLKRLLASQPSDACFHDLYRAVKLVFLREAICSKANFKGPIHYDKRMITRVKRQFGKFLLQFLHLLSENLIVDVQLLIGQTVQIAFLLLNPFQFQPKQRVEIVIAISGR